MDDSQRAADLAKQYKIDVGLHLNFTQELIRQVSASLLFDYHNHIVRFLTSRKYNFLIYNPILRKQFEYVFLWQFEEFVRLYGVSPSHIDGHHHMHLCSNMIIDTIIPKGQKVRRNFSFTSGEKSLLNRVYRMVIDKWLVKRYSTTDYFFSLSERIDVGRLAQALDLAKTADVEIATHPELDKEFEWLMGNEWTQAISKIEKGSYSDLKTSVHLWNKSSN
jgi:predicted glycoside hydrolase/deacetylase ChbG (UPF0249 family)